MSSADVIRKQHYGNNSSDNDMVCKAAYGLRCRGTRASRYVI